MGCFVSFTKIMDSILGNNVPNTLHAIIQCTEVLTVQQLTLTYIKVTNISHLSSHSFQD